MVKKLLKLPSLFKSTNQAQKSRPWPFLPSCAQLKTLSFRAGDGRDNDDDHFYKAVNYVFLDPIETPQSWFTTTSSKSRSFSTESDLQDLSYNACDGESLEMLVRGLVRSSERLFFEPNGDTSSKLEKAKAINELQLNEVKLESKLTEKEKATASCGFPRFRESTVVVATESEDPYEDFRISMEEMVESHGVKDWEGLEELLSWYLRVNEKKNHVFIVGAFVDLLFNSACTSTSTSTSSCSGSTLYSSAVSSLASSSLCLSEAQNEIVDEHVNILTS